MLNNLINALLQFAIGWFVTFKMVKIVGAKKNLATIIKIIGVLLMIGACITITHTVLRF